MGLTHITCLRATGVPEALLFPRIVPVSEFSGGGAFAEICSLTSEYWKGCAGGGAMVHTEHRL